MSYCWFPNDVHNAQIISETPDAIEACCTKCKQHAYFRKDGHGRVEPAYGDFFKADTLQPSSNLYYKVHPNRMHVET